MNLYEINAAIRGIEKSGEYVDTETGEYFDFDALESLEISRYEKILCIAKLIRENSGDVEQMKEAEKRIADRRKAKEKKVQSLKDWLIANTEVSENFGDSEVSVTIKKPVSVLEITGEYPDYFAKI